MNGLLSFLLRNGAGLLRESAEVYLGRVLVRRAMRKLAWLVAFYFLLGIFAVAAAAFFYVLLFQWLSLQLGEESAAAILCGANLLLIALFILGRMLFHRRPSGPAGLTVGALSGALTEKIGTDANFEAGLAAGREIGKRIRKAAPEIAIGAAVIGLIVGIRPQILGLFRRRETPADKPRR